ncbi:MAG: hypothetical protein HGA33_01835 [Candidatus Moranbacteria bacterium]|nr:hypothetical protein [Candidatus Moranbacteria bacterium]
MRKFSKRSIRIFVISAALFVSVISLNTAHAGAWGESYGSAILKQSLEKIQRQIEGVLLGTLKSTAITLLNSRVANLVGGVSSETSLIITDWREYLYQEPGEKVDSAMDNFYAKTLRGRYSNYSSATTNNFESYLKKYSENNLKESDLSSSTSSIMSELSSNPSADIDAGDIALFGKMIASESDPYAYALRAEKYKNKMTEQYEKEAEIKATASGYKGVQDKYGNTILPGSTIGQMVADVQDIGNKVIAAAQNPGELVSGVVTSLVNRTITNLIQNGLGQVQSSIQREIANVDSQIMSQVDVVNRTLGQGAAYTSEVRQRVNVNLEATGSGAATPISTSGN